MDRSCGVLMPIASLPGNQGIGDLGKHGYRLIDALHMEHIRLWQVLPLNPIGFGYSPYQAFSAFAGDEIYINIDVLVEDGLLKQSSIKNFNKFSERIDYDGVRAFKQPYFLKAFRNFLKHFETYKKQYQEFCDSAFWLDAYAQFIALKKKYDQKPWMKWPKAHRVYMYDAEVDDAMKKAIKFEKFLQFIFYKQWKALKAYANSKSVEMIGDIPFYIGLESADVWQNQQDFLINADGELLCSAGVPPDYFSKDGQMWENPIYDWKQLHKEHYRFWIDRMHWNMQQYDILRLDHFRAFDTYWKIEQGATKASQGEWVLGPAYDFFDVLFKALPQIRLVAEDLGDIRPQVILMRDHYHLLGMNILQFELEPKFLKRNRRESLILYPGTHDNNTLEGYYQNCNQNLKIALRRYFHQLQYKEKRFHDLVIRYCLFSNAEIVILPLQDILGLGPESRMNIPGTIGGDNWRWKLKNLKAFYEKLPQIGVWIKESDRAYNKEA